MSVDLLHREEVYAIVGAAMAVHSELGAGFLEAVYQEAMELELAARGIPFVAQAPLSISYKGHLLLKRYVADLVCYGQVLVELKTMSTITGKEQAQLINYLKVTGIRVGLLINFGDPGRLDWERLVL